MTIIKKTKVYSPKPFAVKEDIVVRTLRIKIPLSPLFVKKIVKQVLSAEHVCAGHLSLVFVADPFIRQLNRRFLFKKASTDVLAFDLKPPFGKESVLSGDIVICVDAARQAAQTLDIPLKEEVCRYVIHGLLHLIGYDDTAFKEKKKMWKRQEELLKKCIRPRA